MRASANRGALYILTICVRAALRRPSTPLFSSVTRSHCVGGNGIILLFCAATRGGRARNLRAHLLLHDFGERRFYSSREFGPLIPYLSYRRSYSPPRSIGVELLFPLVFVPVQR